MLKKIQKLLFDERKRRKTVEFVSSYEGRAIEGIIDAYYTVYLVICWAVSFSVCLSVYLIVNKSQFSAFVKLRAMRRLRESNPWIIGLIATICNENFIPEDHQAATSN